MFCIHDEAEAYLETYSNNKAAILHKPDKFIALNDTKNISPTICAHEQEFEFVINLKNEAVRLAAPTWELMLDWVESLRGKLYELRILNPKENLYSKLPEPRSAPLLPTRDPTSPLPPPPPVPLALPPGVEPLATTESHSVASTSSIDHSESPSSSARYVYDCIYLRIIIFVFLGYTLPCKEVFLFLKEQEQLEPVLVKVLLLYQ